MARIRQQKVAAQIQRIVANVLQREIADPRVDGLISVTKVEVTPDLREAKVYLSILGGKRTPTTVMAGITSAGRRFTGEVADKLPLQYVPRLTFHLDESLKRQADILKKIDEAMGDRSPAAVEKAIEEDAEDEKE
jgi:ribosome-binding factor A